MPRHRQHERVGELMKPETQMSQCHSRDPVPLHWSDAPITLLNLLQLEQCNACLGSTGIGHSPGSVLLQSTETVLSRGSGEGVHSPVGGGVARTKTSPASTATLVRVPAVKGQPCLSFLPDSRFLPPLPPPTNLHMSRRRWNFLRGRSSAENRLGGQ
jgi:hypothetical protein